MKTGYLAPIGLEEQLCAELKNIIAVYDGLILAEGPAQKVHWAQNIWHDLQEISFHSITDAAKKLRAQNALWTFYPYRQIRRAELIAAQLPYFSPKPLAFPASPPKAPLGSWTLIDANTMLTSSHCSSPFPHGEVHFQESKAPPGRAYLKLWEIFTKIGRMPNIGEHCLEIGASPGSWTWVLQQLGAQITAIDRALLAPELMKLPNIDFLKKDAFTFAPAPMDWVLSDIVCFPEKLLLWIRQWIKAEIDANFICTLKFQGKNYAAIKEFEKIEGSQIFHLFHNKHELTWFLPKKT